MFFNKYPNLKGPAVLLGAIVFGAHVVFTEVQKDKLIVLTARTKIYQECIGRGTPTDQCKEIIQRFDVAFKYK